MASITVAQIKNGNTEIYANNKGLIYIHRGILYQNIPVYVKQFHF